MLEPHVHGCDRDLVALYVARGVLAANGEPVHLPTRCPCAPKCWASALPEHVPAQGSLASQLSAPWIGARYEDSRTLLLLENLREYGGFDLGLDASPKVGMRFLAVSARAAFLAGQKRLFRTPSKSYPGTLVWHRAVAYVAVWLHAVGRLDVSDSSADALDGWALAAAVDGVAMVQHVKCSPQVVRGEQTAAMWANCGEHLLRGELEVLKPQRVLVLGSGDNVTALRDRVLRAKVLATASEAVTVGRKHMAVSLESWQAQSGALDVLTVPHPAWPGGTDRRFIAAVQRLVRRKRGAV